MQSSSIESKPESHFVSCSKCPGTLWLHDLSKAAARAALRANGWDFVKTATKEEIWFCPEHNKERLEKIRNHSAKRLIVHSDEANAKKRHSAEGENAFFESALDKIIKARGKFERYFGEILSGDEMAACKRLRTALEIVDAAGWSNGSYDGLGVDSLSYGSRTVQQRVLNAVTYAKACERGVIGQVQNRHHDAWAALRDAIENDRPPQDAGDELCRRRKDKRNEKARRALAVEIISQAARAIVDIPH